MSASELPPPPEGRSGWPWTAPPGVATEAPPGGWPRITVVMPSLDQAGYLEEAIRSVLLQGYPNLDFIVVDGGSTDGSLDVIRRYERWMSHWESERDGGQSHALNKGFARADGDIHAYLNSDDLYEPGALFEVARLVVEGHEWVVGDVRCWSDGELAPFPLLPGRSFTRWFTSCPVGQPGSFWSARLHREAGEFREELRYVMDYDYWMRLRFDLGVRPHLVDRPLARYRLHHLSKTVEQSPSFAAELRAVFEPREADLTGWQRLRLWGARRDRKARERGRDAVGRFQGGQPLRGLASLAEAFRIWPPVLFGPAVVLGARALFGTGVAPPPLPPMWPE